MNIIADIGATNTRCALVNDEGNILAPSTFENREFSGIESLLGAYLSKRRTSDRPTRAAVAVAAPILADQVQMTNIGWSFSQLGLQAGLRLRRLIVVNDFEALAWGLVDIDGESRRRVGGGQPVDNSALGVIGPGSGFGVGGLVPHSDGWAAVGGEGGHVTLPASSDEEAQLIAIIRGRFGHCSAERVLSGMGLVNLHDALSVLEGREPAGLRPEEITAQALSGDALCERTLEQFLIFLGTVASDLALTLGARGGIFIAGGIVPRIVDRIRLSGFRQRFEDKGRYSEYVRKIPTYVITEPVPAFRGLRRLLGYR